jgi:glutaconate CoA-transferase subunit A
MPAPLALTDVPAHVPTGCVLGLGGMTLYRRPVAMVRELLRADVGDLEVLAFTGGIETDLLIGAGRVRLLRSCYVGLEIFGLAPCFTSLATSGQLELVEETEATLALGLRASEAGLDFLPFAGLVGTDLLAARPDLARVPSPYSDHEYVAIPALRPDVALIHAPRADRDGNVWLGGNLAVDQALAATAGTTIVSVEQVVDDLDQADLMAGDVDFLVEAPGGAAPTSCWPRYPLGGSCLVDYVLACGAGRFEEYLEAFLEHPLTSLRERLGLEPPTREGRRG